MTVEARAIMITEVATVTPDMKLRDAARLLLERCISAVPVVDEEARVVGMVSEGDLIGRDDAAREARRDWWLSLVAEGTDLNPDFLASLKEPDRCVRDVMSAPVITASESATVREIAHMLVAYHIKRVPIVRDGKLVGIVSRADLLRGFLGEELPEEHHGAGRHRGIIGDAIERLDERFLHGAPPEPKPAPPGAAEPVAAAADFRGLGVDFKHRQSEQHDAAERALAERHSATVKALIDRHVDDAAWKSILHRAREAAEHGAREFLLLQFPSDLCSDGGRRINAPLPDWPSTLRGEAAEIYLRWERELRPQGFRLIARIVDFPDGKPGDAGLFLAWGE
jgi:CBS domain-containing protein